MNENTNMSELFLDEFRMLDTGFWIPETFSIFQISHPLRRGLPWQGNILEQDY